MQPNNNPPASNPHYEGQPQFFQPGQQPSPAHNQQGVHTNQN